MPYIYQPEPAPAPAPLVSQRIAKLQPDGSAIKCLFSDAATLTISRFLASFIHPSTRSSSTLRPPIPIENFASFKTHPVAQGNSTSHRSAM